MKKRFVSLTLTILALLVLLQGCWLPSLPTNAPPPTPEPPIFEEPPEDAEVIETEPIAVPRPGHFTLRYQPEFYMNPILALNRDNILLTSLIYESLFILDENLVAHPLLCLAWDTEDYITFTFEIKPDIAMHDGSYLTADDVAYSLRLARARGRHRSKLTGISSIDSDGDLTVTITLVAPNARFIRLLDIPIIKSGSSGEHIPPGTGPYIFPSPDARQLVRFTRHRHFSDLPLTIIHLLVDDEKSITELFDDGDISLLWDDPTGAVDIRINRQHEPRLYNTTALQFIGFNATSSVLRNSDVRRAIGCSIDRQYIVENVMNIPNPGQTVAAPVAISPIFDLYDPQWEHRALDPLIEMAELLRRAGLEDFNEDGFLEIPDGFGGFTPFTLDFIVNIENAHKRAAAHQIANNLRQFGIDVSVRELQWSVFMRALEDGDFDMFYGEIILGADFDFSRLLLPIEGAINFGRTANTVYKPFIDNFLAASTPEEVSYAGAQLNLVIHHHAPFIPILYKRHAIYSPMGVIMGAAPSQSGVFHNFQEWSIDLLMLN